MVYSPLPSLLFGAVFSGGDAVFLFELKFSRIRDRDDAILCLDGGPEIAQKNLLCALGAGDNLAKSEGVNEVDSARATQDTSRKN